MLGKWHVVFVVCYLLPIIYCLGSAPLLGIDYGTDTFKVMILQGTTPDIILNDQSGRKTINQVGFSPSGERLFGSAAAQLKTKHPDRVISSAHQFLGKRYPDSSIESSRHLFSFNTVNNSGAYAFQIDEKIYTPEEIVAMIIEYATEMAYKFTNQRPNECAIVIPPYVTQLERRGYVDAVKIAGLSLVALSHEGSSTAVQYLRTRLLNEENHKQYTIFYNVGAGHTSATLTQFLIKKSINKLTRKIITNSTTWQEVGGRDFDARLSQFLLQKASEQFQTDLSENKRVVQRIDNAAKKAKEVLSANRKTPVRVESLFRDEDFTTVITREEFESLCADLFQKVLQPIHEILENTMIPIDQIDVEVIGGGSRVIKINEDLAKIFSEERIGRHLNGDEASLTGAIVYAATNTASKQSSFLLKDSLFREVTIQCDSSDVNYPLFTNNSRILASKKINFNADKETHCTLTYENTLLSTGIPREIESYEITGFPDLSSLPLVNLETKPIVKIRCGIDNYGIVGCTGANVTVAMQNISNENETQALAISAESDGDVKFENRLFNLNLKKLYNGEMDVNQLYASRALLRELNRQDAERKLIAKTKNDIESYVYASLEFLDQEETIRVTTEEEREFFSGILVEAEDWVYEGGATLREYQEKLESLREIGTRYSLRITEAEARPEVSAAFHEWKDVTTEALRDIITERNVLEEERDDFVKEIRDLENWLEDKQEKQATLRVEDDPAWLSSELITKQKELDNMLKVLLQRPKRTPTPSPTLEDDLSHPTNTDNENAQREEL